MLILMHYSKNVHKLWKPATGKGFEVRNFFFGIFGSVLKVSIFAYPRNYLFHD